MKINNTWNYAEEVGNGDVLLMNTEDIFGDTIRISKDEVMRQISDKEVIAEMNRSGWDDYCEIYAIMTAQDQWKEDKEGLIREVFDSITRTYLNEDDEIIKTVRP